MPKKNPPDDSMRLHNLLVKRVEFLERSNSRAWQYFRIIEKRLSEQKQRIADLESSLYAMAYVNMEYFGKTKKKK